MKILHIITKFDTIYGAQKHVIECIKNHLDKKHECVVFAGTNGVASAQIEGLGVNVILIPSLKNTYNILFDIKALFEINKQINLCKPDLVISHSTKAGVLSRIICFLKKIPNLFTVQGWSFEKGAPYFQQFAGKWIETIIKPITDSYFCVSNNTAIFGEKVLNIKSNKIYVCPNLHENVLPTISTKLTKNVLMVAGFRTQKDHLTALKAINLLVNEQKTTDLHFTFIGDGPQRGKIEKYIESNQLNKYITLVGETNDMGFYYQNCDIVILPTFYEGLPLCLIEALQYGKPAIATDVGGVNEIIKDGVNGNIIALNDFIGFATLITKYYQENLIESMSLESRTLYSEMYDYEKVSYKLNEILQLSVENSIFSIHK